MTREKDNGRAYSRLWEAHDVANQLLLAVRSLYHPDVRMPYTAILKLITATKALKEALRIVEEEKS